MQITEGGIKAHQVRQLTVATAIALLVHGLVYLGFAIMRPRMLNLPQPDHAQRLQIELWQIPSASVAEQRRAKPGGTVAESTDISANAPREAGVAPQVAGAEPDDKKTEADNRVQGKLVQAMQSHALCVSLQAAGKPVPSA